MTNRFGIIGYSTLSQGIGGSIKRRYSDFIVEEIQENGRVCEAKKFVEKGFVEGEKLVVPENPESKQHLHLDLEKINKDLNFVIRKLARFLQCSKKRFGYAGLKDKRAVTGQRISIFQPDTKKLENFFSRGVELRNPEWSDERIELGKHWGNGFIVVIRDIKLGKKESEKRIKEFFREAEEKGIANFFGEQRFGGLRAITHVVGKELVKKKFEEAVMLYLTTSFEKEKKEIKEARQNLEKTMDFSKAVKEFPKECAFEKAILNHLIKNQRDFLGALRVLPKQMQYLFTHALQSYLFNLVISERLEKGLKKIEGDVLVNNIPTAPLFGFKTKFAEKKAGQIEKMVLEKEGLKPEDFKIREFPELSSKGARKEILLFPKEMKLLEIGKDEFFEGKNFAKISFKLEKGNYATTVLRELMKN